MNDLMKSSELTQLLLQHSIINLNSGIIKHNPREDDNVFGGVWVQPEEETKKNTLSLTGTEIWGPKPQLPSEKSGNSTNSSGKGTSSDVTPEIVPDKRDKFLFGNMPTNQDFTNNFPAYSHFTDNLNSFGLLSPSADIPMNQNLSNNVQMRSEVLLMTDEKLKSLGSVWNNGNNKHPDGLENFAQAIGDWNQQSVLAPSNLSMLQKTSDVSSTDKMPEFCSSFGLQQDFEKTVPCYASGLTTPPWSTQGLKQPLHNNIADNWMKLKSSPDFTGNPLISSQMNKTSQNPQCYSPWDQTGKSFFQNVEDVWGSNSLENQMLGNPQNKLMTNLNNSANIMKDHHSIKFDPSVPPPPLPGLSSLSDLQLLAASTSLPTEQLLNFLKSNNQATQLKAPYMNLTKSNIASSLKSQPTNHLTGGNHQSYQGAQSSISSSQHPWASDQRVNDIKMAVLYRKLARQIYPGQQVLHTRSKKLQQLITLGFKREEAGKVLMNNDLDFELTLGELVFKTAVAKGLLEDPYKSTIIGLPPQYLDINFLKGMPGMNKHGETFHNYITSLEIIVQKQQLQQQQMLTHNSRMLSSQPQIDYTIQALLNSQPNPPLSSFLPNLSFTNTGGHHPYGNNSRYQSSFFDTPGSMTTSPFHSQSGSISNLDPRSPEWVPGSNPLEGGVAISDTRPASDGSLEVATILSNLKLNGPMGPPKDVLSHSWTSGKVFPVAGAPESGNSAFSLVPNSSSSGLSIKEFIPGVPWNKDGGLNLSKSPEVPILGQQHNCGSYGGYMNLMDDGGFSGNRHRLRDLPGIWMPGMSGNNCKEGGDWMMNKKGGAYYNHNYGLDSLENGEEDLMAFNGCHSGDDGGYGESLDGSSPSFQSNWVVIKNLPDTVSEEDMSDALLVYGPVKSMAFMKETRSVLVCYECKQDAVGAKNGFDFSDGSDMAFAKISAEFVPDWTMSLNTSEAKDVECDRSFYGDKEYPDGSDLSSPLADMGYTTPGGLWIPSKVLQNLEFCSNMEDGEEEEDNGEEVEVDDDNDDILLVEDDQRDESAFEHQD